MLEIRTILESELKILCQLWLRILFLEDRKILYQHYLPLTEVRAVSDPVQILLRSGSIWLKVPFLQNRNSTCGKNVAVQGSIMTTNNVTSCITTKGVTPQYMSL